MKVTLDTNVLVSGTLWEGASSKIIDKAERKEVEIILSPAILEEYKEVMEYDEIKEKIKEQGLVVKVAFQSLGSLATIVQPKEKIEVVKEDPDDNSILECAREGKADAIVTNDKHLLKLKEFEGIKILTPEEFNKQTI